MLSRLTSYFFIAVACCGIFATSLSTAVHAQGSQLTASVDRQNISTQETLTLRVRYSGQTGAGQPDFSQVEEHFDIIGQHRSNQMSAINGVINSFTEWTLTLSPKHEGQLLIPSFKFEGHFSDAIQINVSKASAPVGQVSDIFIETEVDHTQVYVQQQLVVTYRLHAARNIDSLDAEPLQISGVSIEELPQTRYQRVINGTHYGVLEVSYALFPQTSDSFTIPPLQWTLRVVTSPSRRSFGFGANRYELMRVTTDKKTIEVKPRPSSYPANQTWLPARHLELREEWSGSPADFRVGEPISRTIHLQAQGLTAAQLPPLPLQPDPTGYKRYPDQPEQDNRAEPQGITGTRTETMAIVPSRAGELTLPAIEVTWWDTETDRLQKARLPAKTLTIQTADGSAPPAAPPLAEPKVTLDEQAAAPAIGPANLDEQRPSAGVWPLLTAVFALLWLLFFALWWRARQRLSASSLAAEDHDSVVAKNEKHAFRDLEKMAQAADLTNLRRALLHWGAHRWPEGPPRSLHQLGQLIDDDAVRQQLANLDAALYGGQTNAPDSAPPTRDELIEALRNWRRQSKASAPESREQRLKPLY